MFRRSAGYRMRVHRVTAMAALLETAGFARVAGRDGRLWRVETWDRVGPFARDRVGDGAGLATS
jgi:hypothetical protein